MRNIANCFSIRKQLKNNLSSFSEKIDFSYRVDDKVTSLISLASKRLHSTCYARASDDVMICKRSSDARFARIFARLFACLFQTQLPWCNSANLNNA